MSRTMPTKHGNKYRLQATISPDVWRWLEAAAERLKISMSEVVARLVVAERTRQEIRKSARRGF